MFFFVYQSFKHTLPTWDPRKANMESWRGQFDMPVLRKSLKKRFSVHGYTTHPLHKVATTLGTDVCGHIVEVEDPKTAVWLKLNYDNISRQDPYHGRELTYIGGYRDIKDEDLADFTKRATEMRTQAHYFGQQLGQLRLLNRNIAQYNLIKPDMKLNVSERAQEYFNIAQKSAEQEMLQIERLQNVQERAYKSLQEEFLTYLKDHEL